jgi:hypothetical protein
MNPSEWQKLSRKQKRGIIKRSGTDSFVTAPVADNVALFDRFIYEAHRVSGRKRYSARTIIEVLRHNTLASDNDKDFKINNDIAPKFARVSMALFPALEGLFELRS